MSARSRSLPELIQNEILDLGRSVERAIAIHAKAVRLGDQDYLDGVALNLHGFYMGVEAIFERIARDLDESLPSDGQWHLTLLTQMATSVPDIRPPVISEGTRQCLDRYRGFRHVVRNIYTFNFVPFKIRELIESLTECHQQLVTDLEAFCEFLELSGEEL